MKSRRLPTIQTTVEITHKTETPNASVTKELGCDWVNETFQNFEVRLILDRKRQLYSKPFSLKDAIVATKDKEFIIIVKVDMTNTVYSNLMVELSFNNSSLKF